MVYLELRRAHLAGSVMSFEVSRGMHALLPDIDSFISAAIIDAILGLKQCTHGEIQLYGESLADSSSSRLRQLRGKVGVVSDARGLISNLKVWENVYLPIEYHSQGGADLHGMVAEAFTCAGYSGDPYASPDTLNRLERKQVLMARAFACRPSLVIVDNLLEGYSTLEKRMLSSGLTRYFSENTEASGLFLTSDAEELLGLDNVQVVTLNQEREHVF